MNEHSLLTCEMVEIVGMTGNHAVKKGIRTEGTRMAKLLSKLILA